MEEAQEEYTKAEEAYYEAQAKIEAQQKLIDIAKEKLEKLNLASMEDSLEESLGENA